MRLDLNKLQKRETVSQGGRAYEVVKNLATPVGVTQQGSGRFWLCWGKVFDDSGSEVAEKDHPPWLEDHLAMLGPKTLAKCGWDKHVLAKGRKQGTPPRREATLGG